MTLSGKTALITGSASGIGNAAVHLFAAEGCRVVATVETKDQIDSVARVAGTAVAAKLDIRIEEDWTRVTKQAVAELGDIDILFNNAGLTTWGDLEATDRALQDAMITVNLTGQFLGCRAVVPIMLAGGGATVNMASINGIRGNTGLIAYSAAKGGIVAMTRSMALDYATRCIRVNCICPETIDTPMARAPLEQASDPDSVLAALRAKHPMGRLGLAEELHPSRCSWPATRPVTSLGRPSRWMAGAASDNQSDHAVSGQ